MSTRDRSHAREFQLTDLALGDHDQQVYFVVPPDTNIPIPTIESIDERWQGSIKRAYPHEDPETMRWDSLYTPRPPEEL